MLNGKNALITGGTKGIGLGISKALLAEGMNIAITSRNHKDVVKIADDLQNSFEGQCIGLVADVRKIEQVKAAVDACLQKWGQLDLVVANAGVGHFNSIDKISTDQWNEVIDINLTGAFHTIKASVDALKASKGYYITIASLAGTNFFANGAAYNASKFGLVGFTQAVMLDLRKFGVKVSTIMPGSVSTYFNNHTPSQEDSWKIQPEDIGQITVDLLKMNPRTLPSKIEVRPSIPPSAQ